MTYYIAPLSRGRHVFVQSRDASKKKRLLSQSGVFNFLPRGAKAVENHHQSIQSKSPMSAQKVPLLIEEIPRPTTWDVSQNLVNDGIFNYQPQLSAGAGFLNPKRLTCWNPEKSLQLPPQLPPWCITTNDYFPQGFSRCLSILRGRPSALIRAVEGEK